MPKTESPLDTTVRQAAEFFGCDRVWLSQQISEAGLRPVHAGRYDLQQIFRLLCDDNPKDATVAGRAQIARTKMLELKAAEQCRDVMHWPEVERLVTRMLHKSRESIMQYVTLMETLGIGPHKSERAERHAQSAIRELELMVRHFDKRLAVRSPDLPPPSDETPDAA